MARENFQPFDGHKHRMKVLTSRRQNNIWQSFGCRYCSFWIMVRRDNWNINNNGYSLFANWYKRKDG